MSCIRYEDDWVHVDDYSEEVERLENRIEDLKDEIENMKDDEVYTLAEIILIRDSLISSNVSYEVISNMNKLIASHSDSVKIAAFNKINEMEVCDE